MGAVTAGAVGDADCTDCVPDWLPPKRSNSADGGDAIMTSANALRLDENILDAPPKICWMVRTVPGDASMLRGKVLLLCVSGAFCTTEC